VRWPPAWKSVSGVELVGEVSELARGLLQLSPCDLLLLETGS
jgi:hypothetical protein